MLMSWTFRHLAPVSRDVWILENELALLNWKDPILVAHDRARALWICTTWGDRRYGFGARLDMRFTAPWLALFRAGRTCKEGA